MKKRMLACALLLMCLAVTALAGGAPEEETTEYFRKSGGEGMPEFIYGENMPGVYTYGGSRRDWIHDMAAAPDGRIAITGYTESSDGTLFDRTKTWRAGWVMMLDQNMNVMWNFCSRSGDADHMRCPVFHDDGTLTVVHETEGKQMKIIRVDQNGQEISSKTVMSRSAGNEIYSVRGTTASGYMLAESQDFAQEAFYTLFDWDGYVVYAYGNGAAFSAVGERHLIAQDKNGLYLQAINRDGTRSDLVRLSRLDAQGRADRGYHSIVSLEDGGAAACGYMIEAHGGDGLLSRWDAQGNLVFEMIVVGNPLKNLISTPDGFAALRIARVEEGEEEIWELVRFDKNGILRAAKKLEGSLSRDTGALAMRADGALVCAQLTGLFDSEDVIVTVVEAK